MAKSSKRSGHDPESARGVHFDKPSGGSVPTPVRVVSGGGTQTTCNDSSACPPGFICAEGSWDQVLGQDANGVYGKIVRPGSRLPALDRADPCTAEGDIDAPNKKWLISRATSKRLDIPCADCGMPAVQNRLIVWVTYPDGSMRRGTMLFNGVCSTDTECGEGIMKMSAANITAAVYESAPYEWSLKVKGFADKGQPFNGAYKLTLAKRQHGVWNNGGDAKTKPLVELRLDVKEAAEWRLTFKLGRFSVIYLQSFQNWVWTRANDLLLAGADAGKKGYPPKLRVTPV